MKKKTAILLLLTSLLFLIGCNSSDLISLGDQNTSDSTQSKSTNNGDTISDLSTDYENALPEISQLALGTFKLETSGYPLSDDQVSDLAFLWKAMINLYTSETVASDEIQAVTEQVEEGYTSEQIKSIAEMKLTIEDMGLITKELGLSFGGRGGFEGDLSPEMQATVQAARDSGQRPADLGIEGLLGPGGGLGGGPGEGMPGSGMGSGGGDPSTLEGSTSATRVQVNIGLLNALVEYLENLK
jgi:hypothetical protein